MCGTTIGGKVFTEADHLPYVEIAPGRLGPPPTVCPQCGHKVKRLGNGRHRSAFCTNPDRVPHRCGYPVPACGWNTTVYLGLGLQRQAAEDAAKERS